MLNRRTWMASIAAGLATRPLSARVADSVGLELYSLRGDMTKSVPKTLAAVRKLGFVDVEVPGLYGLTAQGFRSELDKAGLKCSSYGILYERFRDDIDGGLAEAAALGAKYVMCPWIPHNGLLAMADVERAGEAFNAWGRKCADRGMSFCYHPHGYEFGFAGSQTLFDLLANSTESMLVKFEMDIFWIVRGGENPVELFEEYERRFPLVHLKDMKKGTAIGDLTGRAPDEASVALGKGAIDIPAILKAAAADGGVEHWYIEDESPDAARQIPESIAYLRSIGV